MRRRVSALALIAVTACASPVQATPSAARPTTVSTALDCGELDEALRTSVTEAAELMTGTSATSVQALATSTGSGTPVEERYAVTLRPDDGGTEPQLVEVVRFEDSETWSVRRLETMPAD